MNASMMQPAFLPWLGLFELIYRADVFVFLDDFQFSVQSYHQRNRLFVNKGQVGWYTVPVKKTSSFQKPLCCTQIDEAVPWRKKFWKRIQQNYEKARYFRDYETPLREWLLSPAENLAEQNMAFILMMCRFLGFERQFLRSSEKPSQQQRSERVLELLRWCAGDCYYSAAGSFEYMFEEKIFPVVDICIYFQDYHPRAYNQVGSIGSYVPYLSILDALLNVGPDETVALVKNGTPQWRTWETMVLSRNASPGIEP